MAANKHRKDRKLTKNTKREKHKREKTRLVMENPKFQLVFNNAYFKLRQMGAGAGGGGLPHVH